MREPRTRDLDQERMGDRIRGGFSTVMPSSGTATKIMIEQSSQEVANPYQASLSLPVAEWGAVRGGPVGCRSASNGLDGAQLSDLDFPEGAVWLAWY